VAYDFFSYPVGMNLYLKGSQSPFLSNGKKLLEDTINLNHDTARSAKISYVIASAEARPFYRVEDRISLNNSLSSFEDKLSTKPLHDSISLVRISSLGNRLMSSLTSSFTITFKNRSTFHGGGHSLKVNLLLM
jgi:hypothetical protein